MNLLYHRVNQLQPDPWTLCVSPEHFAEHLQVIGRMSPRPCITFDDGYVDNLLNALPCLEKYDVPARFFITSGAIGRETEMWWDALDLLYENATDYDFEFVRLRLLKSDAQEKELERQFQERNLRRKPRPGRRMLTQDELVQLARSPLAEIGAHTVTHPVLSQLSLFEQEQEIRRSKEWIQDAVGREITGFSYPNGMDTDYTRDTVHLVQQAGFRYAYSAFDHTRSDPFQLPRIMIRDWNGDEFARVLARHNGGQSLS